MKRLTILIALTLSTTLAHAQEQSHIDEAKKLMDLMNADQAIEQAYDQIYAQMSGMAEQLGVSEEQRPMFERYMVKMTDIMTEEMSWAKMEPHMIKMYVSVYTEEELREFNAFYASPAGQKYVAKMPELTAASMELMQEIVVGMSPRLQEIQMEMIAEITASKEEDHEH